MPTTTSPRLRHTPKALKNFIKDCLLSKDDLGGGFPQVVAISPIVDMTTPSPQYSSWHHDRAIIATIDDK